MVVRDRFVLSRDGLLAEMALLEKRKREILSDSRARYVELRIQSLDEHIVRRSEQLTGLYATYGLPAPEP